MSDGRKDGELTYLKKKDRILRILWLNASDIRFQITPFSYLLIIALTISEPIFILSNIMIMEILTD